MAAARVVRVAPACVAYGVRVCVAAVLRRLPYAYAVLAVRIAPTRVRGHRAVCRPRLPH